MKHSLVVSTTACLIVFLSAPVLAHEHGDSDHKKSKVGKMFDRTDANQDGHLQLSEFLAHAEQRFNTMDLNEDGFVTKEEGREAHRKMRAKRKERGVRSNKKDGSRKMFDRTDANQDGQLELSESLAHAEQRFNAMDLNQDGYVTKDEGVEAHQKMREKRKELRKERGDMRHKKGRIGKMFDITDANQDGQLELSEFLIHAEQRFKAMDLNQDGNITKEEGREAHKILREKRKKERHERRLEIQSESVDSE